MIISCFIFGYLPQQQQTHTQTLCLYHRISSPLSHLLLLPEDEKEHERENEMSVDEK
jgi:hypothetical protein